MVDYCLYLICPSYAGCKNDTGGFVNQLLSYYRLARENMVLVQVSNYITCLHVKVPNWNKIIFVCIHTLCRVKMFFEDWIIIALHLDIDWKLKIEKWHDKGGIFSIWHTFLSAMKQDFILMVYCWCLIGNHGNNAFEMIYSARHSCSFHFILMCQNIHVSLHFILLNKNTIYF